MGGGTRERRGTVTSKKSSRPSTQGHYFSLPNAIFYLGLKPGELAVYAYLLFCEDRTTYQCYPSYSTIGRAVGMSKNTVQKYVCGLEEKRLITTEPTSIRTKDGQKRNGSLLYTIRPIQEAVERSTAIQSKGAGRCEREGASWAFLSGVPAGVGNGHTTHRESRHFGANPGKSSSPARTTEHPVESRRNSCLWAGQA